jgi:hypothetical protein
MFRVALAVLGGVALASVGCTGNPSPGSPATTHAPRDSDKPSPQPTAKPFARESNRGEPTARDTRPTREELDKLKRSQIAARFVRITDDPAKKGTPFEYWIELEVKNLTDKDVKDYVGKLLLYDQDGKLLYLSGWTRGMLPNPHRPGETEKTKFNPFFLKDPELSTIKESPDKVKAVIEVTTITFADGSEKKF